MGIQLHRLILLHALVLCAAPRWNHAAEFEVSTTSATGFGSLEQAIIDANANPGRDRIIFNIPGEGVRTISQSSLPPVTDSVEIDGYSQRGARPNSKAIGFDGVLLIQLDQSNGLTLEGPGHCVVRGLSITQGGIGIWVDSPSNVVAGNFIGVAPDGTNLLSNSYGIFTVQATGLRVGGVDPADRNVIANDRGNPMRIDGYPTGVPTNIMVLGNYFGTDASGMRRLYGSATPSTFSVRASEGLVIGGLEPGAGNVIAPGNNGINLYGGHQNTRILGNFIGVAADGQTSTRHRSNVTSLAIFMGEGSVHIEGNTIAYCSSGVYVGGTRATILGNRIYSNGDAGISGTASTNYPILRATLLQSGVVIDGELRAEPSADYLVEFFAARDRSPNGTVQGEHFLGSVELTTSTAGVAAFELSYFTPGRELDWVTATATDAAGNTSRFFPGAQARSETFPHVHGHPSSATVMAGTNLVIQADISGARPMFYQWSWNGENLPGATNSLLTISNIQPIQQGLYQLKAYNLQGSTETQPAQVVVLGKPVFIHHPLSQRVVPGEWVTVSAALRELTTPPIGFRWRSNNIFVASSLGDRTETFFRFRASTNTITISAVATNPLTQAAVISRTASIIVDPDRDGDGLPDVYETQFGLDPDNPIDASQDLDQDGIVTAQEYLAGTDPQNAAKQLKVDALKVSGGKRALDFTASSNKTYRVEYSDPPGLNARDGGGLELFQWQTLASVAARSSNGPVVIFDPSAPPPAARFYRISTPYIP